MWVDGWCVGQALLEQLKAMYIEDKSNNVRLAQDQVRQYTQRRQLDNIEQICAGSLLSLLYMCKERKKRNFSGKI